MTAPDPLPVNAATTEWWQAGALRSQPRVNVGDPAGDYDPDTNSALQSLANIGPNYAPTESALQSGPTPFG